MNKLSPDKVYGPQLANLFQKYCEAVQAECKATTIKVKAEFILKLGKGDLQMKTFTTPDAKTERMLDPETPMPRGSKLQNDAMASVQRAFLAAEIAVQKDTGRRLDLFEQKARALLDEMPKLSVEQKAKRWAQLLPLLQPPTSR
jgi:hypothetical protein